MAWPLSLAAQQALSASFVMSTKCTIYSPLFGVLDDLPISGGEVVCDSASQVRRTATLQADPRYWPRSPGDLLSPFGSAVQIYYGIGLPSGDFEWVPQGYLSIDDASRDRPIVGDADIGVGLVDLSARVAEDRFDAPVQTLAGATRVAEIIRLIRETLGPDVVLVDETGAPVIAPVIEIERDRWADGVEKLADAVAGEAFFDQIGRAVVRPQPTLLDAPIWYVSTGRGGNLLQISDRQSRDLVYNRFVVSGQRSDGTDPVLGIATETEGATAWGGPFGKKSRFYSSPLITSTDQAVATALGFLARSRGVAAAMTFKNVPNPALESGDVLDVRDEETGRSVQIIDKLTTPLTPENPQSVTTRAIMLPADV